MKTLGIILWCGLAAQLTMAGVIETVHCSSADELEGLGWGNGAFVARGEMDILSVSRTDPPAEVEENFSLWNNGVPHAFQVVYNPVGEVTALSVDDVHAILEGPLPIGDDAHTLLLSAGVVSDGGSVVLDNLKITLPGFVIYDVGDSVSATAEDYLLVQTDLPLSGGFILSGTATLTWDEGRSVPTSRWFEVTPAAVVPEPAGGLLLAIGLCGFAARRRGLWR